ncbi:ATP-binding protein [Alteribacillus sp. HJP-4]|uniref:ATP-binding protein n=1 Tax=Alteribacillus sp. HJP-4 TaxID=2775394 RepID=UPI0035CCD946
MKNYSDQIAVEGKSQYKKTREKIKEWLKILTEEDQFTFEVAVNEAINNAISHGTGPGGILAEVYLRVDEEKIVITVADFGPTFSKDGNNKYDESPGVILKETAEALTESGRGIAIMKKWSDKLLLDENGKKITLVKYYQTDSIETTT